MEDFEIVALEELLEAARLCLGYRKEKSRWKHDGVLGYPAAVLLLTFVDSVGYLLTVKGTQDDKGAQSSSARNFNILRLAKYFDPPLSSRAVVKLYGDYRGYLLHQSSLSNGTSLNYTAFNNSKAIIHRWEERPEMWQLNLDKLLDECENLLKNYHNELIASYRKR